MKTAKKTELPKLTKMEQKYFDLLSKYPEGIHRSHFSPFHQNGQSSNVIDVHIKNLRRKVSGLYEISTEYGFGYSMRPV